MENKATEADKKLKTLEYHGDRKRFNIEEYYKSITEAFIDLTHVGPSNELNEHQKVLSFENGLQNDSAIRYDIDAKIEGDVLLVP